MEWTCSVVIRGAILTQCTVFAFEGYTWGWRRHFEEVLEDTEFLVVRDF